MKRFFVIFLIAALLCACTGTPAEPVVETDTRAQTTPEIETDLIESKPTEAPSVETQPTEAPEQPTEAPAQTFVQQVVNAWTSQGLLEGMAPYSDADLLDLYGIDLSACVGGAGYAEIVGYVKEAVIVEADEATAAEIEQLLTQHVAAVKEQFRSYDPDAYALAEKAVLVRSGGVVLMIISPDAEAMKAAFDALLP